MSKPARIAETAQQFKEKYRNKRFSSSTAGKSVIYEYLYRSYQVNDRIPQEEREPLYKNLDKIKSKVETADDANIYNMYVRLEEWIAMAFRAAIIMRNALQSEEVNLSNLIQTIIVGETIRAELKEQNIHTATLDVFTGAIDIDSYTPQAGGSLQVAALLRNIDSGGRYVTAYNTLIETIAEAIDIPELCLVKVEMGHVEAWRQTVNTAMQDLREDVATHRTPVENFAGYTNGEVVHELTRFTPEYLRETMKLFEDIPEPPPVPEEKIKTVKESIYESFTYSHRIKWDSLFLTMTAGYWR